MLFQKLFGRGRGGRAIRRGNARRTFVRQLSVEGLEMRALLSASVLEPIDNTYAIVAEPIVAGPLAAGVDAVFGAKGSSFKDCTEPNHDPDGNGVVGAGDVLFVINQMIVRGGVAFRLNMMDGEFRWDTNGDGWLTARDPLNIINDINANGPHAVQNTCTVGVTVQQVSLGNIEALPGQIVLVVAADIASKEEAVFFNSVPAIGTSDYFQLRVNGSIVAETSQGGTFSVATGSVMMPFDVTQRVELYAKMPNVNEGWFAYNFGGFVFDAMPGATVLANQYGDNDRVVHVVETIQKTQISTYSWISGADGRVDIGAVKWGDEQLPDKVNLSMEARGPNIDGYLITSPFYGLSIKAGDNQYIIPASSAYYVDNSSGTPVIGARSLIDLPQDIAGQKWTLQGVPYDGDHTSLLVDAEYRLFLTDEATGANIAMSDWTPIVIGGGLG